MSNNAIICINEKKKFKKNETFSFTNAIYKKYGGEQNLLVKTLFATQIGQYKFRGSAEKYVYNQVIL